MTNVGDAGLPVLRTGSDTYSYECRACSRCCHHKGIPVGPYELARLAAGLGITTTALIRDATAADAALLRQQQNGACVFLTPAGCGVYAERPLACRLYPLGCLVTADGTESFVELVPHPASEGVTGDGGTVEGYLEAQGVDPYKRAAERYLAVYRSLTDLFAAAATGGDESAGLELDPRAVMDVDLALGYPTPPAGLSSPAVAEWKIERHLQLLNRWAATPSDPAALG
jgi:uncharacterized protein